MWGCFFEDLRKKVDNLCKVLDQPFFLASVYKLKKKNAPFDDKRMAFQKPSPFLFCLFMLFFVQRRLYHLLLLFVV